MAPQTVLLKGDPIRKEAVAAGAITPGHLIARDANGKVGVHAAAAGNTGRLFAVENDIIGKGINDAYAVDDQVQFGAFRPGDEVYALVPAAAAAIVIGNQLESTGDGTLKILAAGTPLATALEAVDNSAGATPARIKVEIM